MAEAAGKINAYQCEVCGKETVTINYHTGTTPFMIKCRSVACGQGMAQSKCYNVPQYLLPQYEWYIPDEEQLKTLSPEIHQHVKMGGMILRRLDGSMRELHYGCKIRRG